MAERRKRRTFSDAGTPGVPIEMPAQSPLAQGNRTRRQSNNRHARLVMFPPMANNPHITASTSAMPMITQPPFMPQFPQQQILQPYITPNAMYFTLPPGRADLSYSFWLEIQAGQTVKLFSPVSTPGLSFSMNGVSFPWPTRTLTNEDVGVYVNQALKTGENRIAFSTIGATNTVFAELRLGAVANVHEMIRQVMEVFPPIQTPGLQMAGLDSTICPLSGKEIQHPVRGVNCQHSQCFDLQTFLERGLETGNWACPVCTQTVQFENLRYDPQFGNSKEDSPTPFLLQKPNEPDIFGDFMNSGFDAFDGIDRDF